MQLRALSPDDLPELHAAFLEAFAGYGVRLQPGAEEMRRMLVRRGAEHGLSVLAVEGGRIAGFAVTGFGTWDGRLTAYDVVTGVVPAHRGKGLAGELLAWCRPRARERGAERFLLEVLCGNEPAIRAYRRAGFAVTRELGCHELPRDAVARLGRGGLPAVEALDAPDWAAASSWADWRPSWQNAREAVLRSDEERLFLAVREDGRQVGHAVLFPASGDLAQLAVAPPARRRGAGRALLAAALGRLAEGVPALRILNVPCEAAADVAFYAACGARRFTGQYEMSASLR